jgi:sugar/nucleoside kinase (ribokinase family)
MLGRPRPAKGPETDCAGASHDRRQHPGTRLAQPMTASVTVLGNLSVDLVNDDPPSAGGCPSFAGVALAPLGEQACLVTRAAPADLPLFEEMLAALAIPYRVLPAATTSSFGLRYTGGDDRVMTVEAIGPSWTPEDLAGLDVGPWVHVSPLLRSDFPVEVLAALAARGCQLSYDGQGLVRASRLGHLTVDADFDPAVLRYVRVLKLADDEADVLAGRPFDADAAAGLGVPEVVVTHGSGGCDLYLEGTQFHVRSARQISGVHTTGAGDMFTVTYVAGRAAGLEPLDAARQAGAFVADRLQERLGQENSAQQL